MKQINKALSQILYDCTGMDSKNHPSIVEAMLKLVEFTQKWIPVEEELPQHDELVLVKYNLAKGCDEITVLELSDEDIWHYRGDDFFRQNITHWRPIELE